MSQEVTLRCFEACTFVWNKLWSFDTSDVSHRHYNKFDICDVVIFHHEKIKYWLFSTKIGEVKNRSRNNRTLEMFESFFLKGALDITGSASRFGIIGNSSVINDDYFGEFMGKSESSSIESDFLVYRIKSPEELREICGRKETIKIFVFPKSNCEKMLRIEYVQEKMGREHIKCYLLAQSDISGYAIPPSQTRSNVSFGLSEVTAIPCRNKHIISLCKDFCDALVKLVQSRSDSNGTSDVRKVEKLTFSVACEDNADSYRLWLYLIDEIVYIPQGERNSSLYGGSKAASSMTSVSLRDRYLSKRFICPGDFCGFLTEKDSGLHRHTHDDVMNMIFDEIDIKGESHRAIVRHKRDASEDVQHSAGPIQREEYEDVTQHLEGATVPNDDADAMKSKVENDSEGGERRNLSVDCRGGKFKILYKDLVLAREEMEKLREIEQKALGLFSPIDYDEIAAIRRSIEDIWPLRSAEFFFSSGYQQKLRLVKSKSSFFGSSSSTSLSTAQQSVDCVSRTASVGQLPALLRRKLQPLQEMAPPPDLNGGEAPNSDSAVQEKLFSFYFSSVEVCESCYLMYHELEKYRNERNSRFYRDMKVSKELASSEEERRSMDREVEKKIFQQRRLMSRLSKPPVPVSMKRSSSVEEPRAKRTTSKRKKTQSLSVPPLLAYQRIMNKKPVSASVVASAGEGIAVEKTFSDMREASVQRMESQHTFKPTLFTASQDDQKLTVNSKNYSAEHLLHSWHRDMNRLRSLIHQKSASQPSPPSSHLSNPRNAYTSLPGLTEGDSLDSDHDDDEGPGDLGWNPFAVK